MDATEAILWFEKEKITMKTNLTVVAVLTAMHTAITPILHSNA